jgi:hypothetical protein
MLTPKPIETPFQRAPAQRDSHIISRQQRDLLALTGEVLNRSEVVAEATFSGPAASETWLASNL